MGKTRTEISNDYRQLIVFITVEIKLRFRDGLMWTVGLTVEIKLRFRDGLAWTVDLSVEIKLRLRDGLVRTVGLKESCAFKFLWRFMDAAIKIFLCMSTRERIVN